MNSTVISFGTNYPITYRKNLNYTRKTCRRFNIPHYLWQIDQVLFRRSGWLRKVLYKPTFIKEMLLGFDTPIVWIDADCRLLDQFELPEGDWDVGLIPHQILRNRIHFTPWLSSFMVFRPTAQTKILLRDWEWLCQDHSRGEGDHERLMWALNRVVKGILRVQNILPYLRGKVFLDPRHRKRTKLTYEEMPAELDNWYPEEVTK